MQLSQKQKTFSQFVAAFLQWSLKFQHFQKKKKEPHRWFISEITDSKERGYKNLWKVPFQRTLLEATCKGDKALLKSELHHLYPIYRSLSRQLSQKKCLLVRCKVLTMLANIVTADENYSVLNRDNLRQPIQMQLYQKQKTFSQFVSTFLKWSLKFSTFSKKGWPSYLLYFLNYVLLKRWLNKSLKSHLSEDPSGSNM